MSDATPVDKYAFASKASAHHLFALPKLALAIEVNLVALPNATLFFKSEMININGRVVFSSVNGIRDENVFVYSYKVDGEKLLASAY